VDAQLQRAQSALSHLGSLALFDHQLEAIELTLAEGNYPGARAPAAELVQALASWRGGSSTRAEALLLLGIAERGAGELDRARAHLQAAILEAEDVGDPMVRFQALRELSELAAYELERVEMAALALALAEAPLEQLGDPPQLRAASQITAAMIAESKGDYAESEALLREALARQQEAGASPRQLDQTRMRIANSLGAQGRSDDALTSYREILATQGARLGVDHPQLAGLHFNIGLTLTELARWDDARPSLELALHAQERGLGPTSPRVAQVLTTLSEVETELHNFTRAIELGERAARIQAERLPPDHVESGTGRFAQAWALLQGGELERSLEAHRLLLDELSPAWADQRPSVHVNIGWLLCRLGRHGEVEAHLEQGMRSEDAAVRARARALGLELALMTANAQLAATLLDQLAVEIQALPAADIDPTLSAELLWLRVRVAALERDDPVEVAKLARLAAAQGEQLQADQLAELAALSN
jgi:tetratricopeptide (TPR) repeat protein